MGFGAVGVRVRCAAAPSSLPRPGPGLATFMVLATICAQRRRRGRNLRPQLAGGFGPQQPQPPASSSSHGSATAHAYTALSPNGCYSPLPPNPSPKSQAPGARRGGAWPPPKLTFAPPPPPPPLWQAALPDPRPARAPLRRGGCLRARRGARPPNGRPPRGRDPHGEARRGRRAYRAPGARGRAPPGGEPVSGGRRAASPPPSAAASGPRKSCVKTQCPSIAGCGGTERCWSSRQLAKRT